VREGNDGGVAFFTVGKLGAEKSSAAGRTPFYWFKILSHKGLRRGDADSKLLMAESGCLILRW
jgi:hypothetical protein